MGEGSACQSLSRHQPLRKCQENIKTSLELLPSAQSSSRNEKFVSTSNIILKTENEPFLYCAISHEN